MQIAFFLQVFKIHFPKDVPKSGQQYRVYVSKIKLGPPLDRELVFFHALQEALSRLTTLVLHNANKTLWIDFDASKEFGFSTIAFLTKGEDVLPERK